MKIAITGHTSELGKQLFDHFNQIGNQVLGISRATGFNIVDGQEKIVSAVENFDLFICNTHVENYQTDLLKKIVNKVPMIIVIGSAMHLFRDIITFPYLDQKFLLSHTCRNLNVNPSITSKILHVNISFLPPNLTAIDRIRSDNAVEFKQITNLIDYWICNPIFTDVTLEWKMTPVVVSSMQEKFPNLKIDLW